ncbi:MAG: class I SAM-dependent methyltransferase [Deltaproteobacteria bacterium]|nr:class I SAM-dependent methyltransferase [Deltaproteobacteria bacterium]
MTDGTDSSDHWPRHAHRWALVGPPLRPCPADVAHVERAVAGWAAAAGRGPRALLLGVTPELATMRWPAGTELRAVDRSAAMIAEVFPATGTPPDATAVQGEWCALPCADAVFDVAVGDGAPANLSFPGDYARFAGELARVLAPGGQLVLRLFAAQELRETLDDVARELRAGRIGSFHALKWRIAMALYPDERDVPVVEIAAAFDAMAPDRAWLSRLTAWTPATIATIDNYRGSALAYSFPKLASVEDAFAAHFAIARVLAADYELGERCPTVVWTRR